MTTSLRDALLRGLFLGFWLYQASLKASAETRQVVLGWGVGGFVGGTLVAILCVGFRFRPGFSVFRIPQVALLLGSIVPAFLFTEPAEDQLPLGTSLLLGMALAGLAYPFRRARKTRAAVGGGLAVVSGLVIFRFLPSEVSSLQLILPLFLLFLASETTASVAEVGVLLGFACAVSYANADIITMSMSLMVYLGYSFWLHDRLTKFRGRMEERTGRISAALAEYAKLPRDAQSESRRCLVSIDLERLEESTARTLNYDYCLETVNSLYLGDRPPSEQERREAERLLKLVESQRRDLQPVVDYLRAVGSVHARDYDSAADLLKRLLDPGVNDLQNRCRREILFPAWRLATLLHPEMTRRLGEKELALPGRRLEAISAVERQPAGTADGVTLRRLLYAGLTRAEFPFENPPSGQEFSYGFAEELGQALVTDTDPDRITRGLDYLAIAERGLPDRALEFAWIRTETYRRIGNHKAERRERSRLIEAAQQQELLPEARGRLLTVFLREASDQEACGQFYEAITSLRRALSLEPGRLDFYRRLCLLYEKRNDPLNALLTVESALRLAPEDVELKERKRSYLYSVTPDRMASRREVVAPWFDLRGCLEEARRVVESRDLELAAWGLHLVQLVRIFQPGDAEVRLLAARLLLTLNRHDAAFEELKELQESPDASLEKEIAHRYLGDLYLDHRHDPQAAITCYEAFRKSERSGVETLFRLGRAYEAVGDRAAAIHAYKLIGMTRGHPLALEAEARLRELT